MAWARFDDGFDDDPDVRMLSDQAVVAHVCATTWSSRHLTNGFIPVTALPTLRVTRDETVKELCSVCMPGNAPFWYEVEGGYQIRSYLKFNPSKEQVLKERAASSERVGRFRNGARNAVTNAVTNASVTPAPVPVNTSTSLRSVDVGASATKARFKPPSADEVASHFREKGFPLTEGRKFFAYYGSQGWKVGKNPMKDWHLAAAGWMERADADNQHAPVNGKAQTAQDVRRRALAALGASDE